MQRYEFICRSSCHDFVQLHATQTVLCFFFLVVLSFQNRVAEKYQAAFNKYSVLSKSVSVVSEAAYEKNRALVKAAQNGLGIKKKIKLLNVKEVKRMQLDDYEKVHGIIKTSVPCGKKFVFRCVDQIRHVFHHRQQQLVLFTNRA